MLTSNYHVSTDSSLAILFYWCVLFISMVTGELFAKVKFQKYVFVPQFFQNIDKNMLAKANVFCVKVII